MRREREYRYVGGVEMVNEWKKMGGKKGWKYMGVNGFEEEW